MTPVDVKSKRYIDSSKEINNEDRKFKKLFLLLEYQKTKGYTTDGPEEVFMIKNAKRNAQWTYVIIDLNGEETVETFLGNCEKHIRKGLKPKK